MAARKSGWLWLIVLIAIISIAINIAYWASGSKSDKGGKGTELYTCPMHPQVVQDHPGDCPICGMKLVKKMTSLASDEATDSIAAEVNLSPSQEVLAAIATERVQEMTFQGSFEVPGAVSAIEGNITKVSNKAMGRIERLYVDFTGASVRKDQPLYQFYSPDIASAAQELNLANSVQDATLRSSLQETARAKLASLGLSEAQIAGLPADGNRFTFTSPASGIIMDKMAMEGDWVMPGMTLFEIADLSSVWIEGVLYEKEIQRVHLEDEVQVGTDAYPGELFAGSVTWIAPMLDMMARTLPFRLTVSNPDGRLKPGMFVRIYLKDRTSRTMLAVPESAVLRTGGMNLVWVKIAPGKYNPRHVQLDNRMSGYYPVLSGLSAGEEIVTQGAYLIDSDSQIRSMGGGIAPMPGMEHGGGAGEKPSGESMPGMEMPPGKESADTMKISPGMDMTEPNGHEGHNATPAAPLQGGKIEQEVYTCPMHPEVISNKPGKCPKCGMTLVKKTP